jgi:hypothetical protein
MPKKAQKSNDRFRFRCYAPSETAGGFYDWYDALPDDVQAEVDVALETLLNSRRPWPEQLFKHLRKDLFGLGRSELKWNQPTATALTCLMSSQINIEF